MISGIFPMVDGKWFPLPYLCLRLIDITLCQSSISSHCHLSLCGYICLQLLLSLLDFSCSLMDKLLFIHQQSDQRLLPQFPRLSLIIIYHSCCITEIYVYFLFCAHQQLWAPQVQGLSFFHLQFCASQQNNTDYSLKVSHQ